MNAVFCRKLSGVIGSSGFLLRLQHHADKRFHRHPPPFVQSLDVRASQVFLRAVPEIDLIGHAEIGACPQISKTMNSNEAETR
jgi:hypothetical protein